MDEGILSMKFLENDNYYRPLQMVHGSWGYKLWHPYPLAMLLTKRKIKKYLKMGYGGGVLQPYNGTMPKTRFKNYLTNDKNFKYFRGVLKLCKKMGFRVWIYDESGYPSGGAMGKTVRAMPEAEAYGIICNPHPIKKGESISLTLPYGHEKLKSVLFDDGSGAKDITSFANENGSIVYVAEADGTLYYIASKVIYEGSHPTRKFGVPSRYIDVMDKKAVAKFLEITFEKYIKYVGDFFGNTIEAVFTDEPSVLNQYFSELVYNPPFTVDKIDNKIPLYKFVVWSRNFENEFKACKGYDITPNIPKLFESSGDSPCKIKQDYYEVCRDLYKEAYFEQYKEFCEKLGLKLSGHLLGEEVLQEQIINELDFFEMCKPMHYPGIDLLTCEPEKVKAYPLLLRTVSSAAALEGKPIVMSETGNHSDDKTKITKEKTLCSLLLEYANGINTVTTYMSKWKSAEGKKHCFDRIAKVGQLLEKGKFYSELLVYYPVKSGYAFNTPSIKGHNERDYDPIFAKICNGLNKDLSELEKGKIQYNLLSSRYMEMASVQKNEVCVGKCLPFKAIYIPYCYIEAEGIESDILRLAQSGAKIFVNRDTVLTPALKELKNIHLVKSAEQVATLLYTDFSRDFYFEGDTENIVYCRKISDDRDTYMFVNSSNKATEFKVKIKQEATPIGYDVTNNTEFTPTFEKKGEYQSISISLAPYEAKLLVF